MIDFKIMSFPRPRRCQQPMAPSPGERRKLLRDALRFTN
jgi:hypothetical protein